MRGKAAKIPVCVFICFSDYGRVLCTNKRLYIRSYENLFS